MNQKELDFWIDKSAGDKAVGPTKEFFGQVAATVGPYISSGAVQTFDGEAGHAAQHAAHLSSQLLTFSKGGAPLKRVASVANHLAQAAEFSLYGSNLRSDIDLPSELWKAEVDPAQIGSAEVRTA